MMRVVYGEAEEKSKREEKDNKKEDENISEEKTPAKGNNNRISQRLKSLKLCANFL